jgi:PBP1b-binding outer membrane lipoprotein LpoB
MQLIKAISSLGLALLLVGCAGNDPAAPVGVKRYTQAEQQQIAKEHNALPENDILRSVLDDWERMRRALR